MQRIPNEEPKTMRGKDKRRVLQKPLETSEPFLFYKGQKRYRALFRDACVVRILIQAF